MLTVVKKKAKRRGRRVKVATAILPASQRPRRSQTRSLHVQRLLGPGPAAMMAREYLNTLNDPFEYPPLKLGYDCYVGSSLATLYLRSVLTVNADGSFAVYLFPNNGSFLNTNVSGNLGTTWVHAAPTNSTPVGNYSAGRVISGGVRVFPLVASTNANGILQAGTIAYNNQSQVNLLSPSSLSQLPGSELGFGKKGATAIMRPQDNDSFVFWPSIVNAVYQGGAVPQMSIPYICGNGYPVGTQIWYEAIMNIECLAGASSSLTIGQDPNMPNPEPALSDYFPSPEALFSTIKAGLSDSAIMDGVEGVSSFISPHLGTGVRALRSTFGSGTHARNHRNLMAGQSSAFISRQNSVLIEEMKDDYDRV